MSTLTHSRQIFPQEIYNLIARRFNGVVGRQIFKVKGGKMLIQFHRHPNDDKTVFVGLFKKLLESFQSIKKKYFFNDPKHSHLRLKISENQEYYIITLFGAIYIPPGKIFNLFNLILWYFIRYKTGLRPNQSKKGKALTQQWRLEEQLLKHEINSSSKILHLTLDTEPCHICGKMTQAVNHWVFQTKSSRSPLQLQTRVCERHRSKLI
jgi:hypothetical protein